MLIKANDLFVFLQKETKEERNGFQDIIYPAKPRFEDNGHTFFSPSSTDQTIVLDSYRTVDPTKMLFYLTRERLTPEEFVERKRLLVGVKGCDLKAMELLDRALLHENFVDPAYKNWRTHTTVVTTDCLDICDTCHCTLVGGKPYSETGFDVNLSRVDDAYLITVGSDKGEELVNAWKKEFRLNEATDAVIQKVKDQRQSIIKRLEEQNAEFTRTGRYDTFRSVPNEVWEEASKSCIGCGACTHICPTCYCIILNDESKAEKFIKEKSYDSCQLYGYARVAGGGTPRPNMSKRFRNRYLCKFDYMAHNFDTLGCTGCGRCTETCAGKIDLRKVVQQAEKAVAA